jgi:hypothetical protein
MWKFARLMVGQCHAALKLIIPASLSLALSGVAFSAPAAASTTLSVAPIKVPDSGGDLASGVTRLGHVIPLASSAPDYIAPGSSIGTAWPPLQGGHTYHGSYNKIGPENWYALYKNPDTKTATVTVTNTTPPGSPACALADVHLYTNEGTGDQVGGDSINNSQAVTFTVPATEAGDPQGLYYLEISGDGDYCGSAGAASYTIAPKPEAEYANPARVPSGSIAPGSSIGSAWPPLQGGLSYPGSYTSIGPENWYALYKKNGKAATIRIANTTVDGSTACAQASVNLYTNQGTGDRVDSIDVDNNAATTFTIPGTQPGDPQGLYYLEISGDGDYCGSAGAASYTIEPEPSTQYTNPARVPSGSIAPGSSIGSAWPPLQGGLSYPGSYTSIGPENWYALYKKNGKAATIRIANTTVDGSTACAQASVNLYTNQGTGDRVDSIDVDNNAATTFTIPGTQPGDPQGLYYLEISGDGDYCGSAGAASYTIEPEPSTQYTKPMLLPGGPNMKAAGGPLAGHVTYGASLSNARQDWTYFTSNGSHTVTARIENTTDSQDGCQEVSVALENANGSTVDSATLADEGAAKIVISLSGTFYLKLTADGCTPTPNAPLTADIILTPASGMNGPVLTVSGTTLAKATAGTAYSSAIGVTGGTGPYTFRPETALPPGLSLNDQTGAISGTPAKPGTYNFMIEITDSAQPAPNSITERFHLAVS